jgi:hypothetical protein
MSVTTKTVLTTDRVFRNGDVNGSIVIGSNMHTEAVDISAGTKTQTGSADYDHELDETEPVILFTPDPGTLPGSNAIGVGNKVKVSGQDCIALGTGCSSKYNKSIAIGDLAESSNSNAIAIGTKAKAIADYSIMIGADNSCNSRGRVALGNKKETTSFVIGEAEIFIDGSKMTFKTIPSVNSEIPVASYTNENNIVTLAVANDLMTKRAAGDMDVTNYVTKNKIFKDGDLTDNVQIGNGATTGNNSIAIGKNAEAGDNEITIGNTNQETITLGA